MAANEAVAAGYAEITVAHLLIALAKVSDANGGTDSALSEPARREFEQLGIEPRRFRRRLRELSGTGGSQLRGGVLHRSAACKAVMSIADRLAAQAGVPVDAGLLVRAAFIAWALPGGGSDDGSRTGQPAEEIPTEL